MSIPSSTAWGSPSMRERFMKAPGSPSSALQIRYRRSLSVSRQTSHLRQVGKPAPPRPRSPEFLTISRTSLQGRERHFSTAR